MTSEVTQAARDAAIELAALLFGNGHSVTVMLKETPRHFMLDAFARFERETIAHLAHRGGEVVEPRTIYVQWAENGNIRKWAWSEFDLAEKLKVETMPVSDTTFAWAYHYTQKHPGQTKLGAMDIKRDRHKGPIAAGWTETPLYAGPPTVEVARLREALQDVVNPLAMLQRQAEAEGNQLSGMAYSIANDLHFVQSIASQALGDTP